jgi:predicted O-linked N-acetylglucosamine transferase (SPINDLY family)
MEFTTAYQHTIQHVKEIDRNLYEIGMRTFEKSSSKDQKEILLLQLLSIYPNDAEICYKMATIFENDLRSMVWHKMCFSKDPCHKENIISAIQTLYSNGLHIRVFDYIKTPIFNELMEDPRFLYVYSRCNFQQLYYKNGINHLLKLIDFYSKKSAITYDDKKTKWSNYHDLGYVYCIMGEVDTALKYTKKAVELADKFGLDIHNRLLSFSNFLCYADFKYSDKNEVFKEYLKINNYLPEKPLFSHSFKKPKRKPRIGYVSSDYIYHAVANFTVPILENHDRSKFDIILYSNQPEFTTDIFTQIGLSYKIIHGKSDEDVARMIYADGIDILIDLNGHTIGNRLGVFRYKPAPIQITYLGYPNTTGLKSIQYRITDNIADAETEYIQPYSEKLLRLPRCFLLYKPFHQKIPVKPKLTGNTIILGSMNKENKTSSHALDTWATILNECPNTKLMIKIETFDNNEERLAFYMERLRTTMDRIIIINKLGNAEYNEMFSKIDILLDPFPYSGTTTTCNALFNSIPVVTLYHEGHHAHNVSASILTYSGLSEFVAKSRENYISIVKELVKDSNKIEEYKRTIHTKFKSSIMDPVPFMRDYERTFMQLLS